MKRIKIIYIIEAAEGGTLTYLDLLLKHIDLKRFEPTVILSDKRPGFQKPKVGRWKSQGMQVYIVPMARAINLLTDVISFIHIVKILRNDKYDILHAISSKGAALGGWAGWLTQIPLRIYSPHGLAHYRVNNPFLKVIYRWLDDRILGLFHRIVAIANTEAASIACERNAKGTDIVVIRNAVEIEVNGRAVRTEGNIYRKPSDRSVFVVGWIGRMVRQKRPELFLRIALCLCKIDQRVNFMVVGNGTLQKSIQSMANQLGIGNRILFIDHMDDIMAVYRQFDLLVNTSDWEGMSYVVLEAMANRVPVVAADIPAHREIIHHGENGILFPKNDGEGAAKEIMNILTNSKYAHQLSEIAYQYVKKQHNIEDWIKQKEELYLMAEKRR